MACYGLSNQIDRGMMDVGRGELRQDLGTHFRQVPLDSRIRVALTAPRG